MKHILVMCPRDSSTDREVYPSPRSITPDDIAPGLGNSYEWARLYRLNALYSRKWHLVTEWAHLTSDAVWDVVYAESRTTKDHE